MSIPETENNRVYLYLAKIAGKSVQLTEPRTRLERFLAYWAGMDVVLPDAPYSRLERFLLAAMGEGELPSGCYTRYELFLNNIAGGVAALPETDNDMIERYLREIASAVVEIVYEGNLPTTISGAIHEFIRYGKCVQDGTPTPSNPVDIVCNNGAIKVSRNLCDVVSANIVVGKYINNSGTEVTDTANFYYAPYIPVTPSGTYTIATSSSIWYFSVMQYDSSQNFLRRSIWGATNTPVGVEKTFDVGADCAYIRFGSNMKKATVTEADVLAVNWMLTETATSQDFRPYGEIYTDGTPEALTVGEQTLSVPMLLDAGDYKDAGELISGIKTGKVGIYVFNGTESFIKGSAFYTSNTSFLPSKAGSITPICTHFTGISSSATRVPDSLTMTVNGPSGSYTGCVYFYADRSLYATVDDFKAWLAEQYRNGTPVVVLYPRSAETTEEVTPQPITSYGSVSSTTNAPPAEVKITYHG